MQKNRITVSPEMAAFIDEGMVDPADYPADAVVLCFSLGEDASAHLTVTTGALRRGAGSWFSRSKLAPACASSIMRPARWRQ